MKIQTLTHRVYESVCIYPLITFNPIHKELSFDFQMWQFYLTIFIFFEFSSNFLTFLSLQVTAIFNIVNRFHLTINQLNIFFILFFHHSLLLAPLFHSSFLLILFFRNLLQIDRKAVRKKKIERILFLKNTVKHLRMFPRQ